MGAEESTGNHPYSGAAKSEQKSMTQDELFKKATRFDMGQGIILDKGVAFFADGFWSFHRKDLVLHKTRGWIHVSKAGLTGTHFPTALEAADFLEQFWPN
jgi:hypothetical protein